MKFIGVDLGWYGKPSGVAVAEGDGPQLRLSVLDRLDAHNDVLGWIASVAGRDNAIVAVDAPLIIMNSEGPRTVDREISRNFGRFHASCHSANLKRPFAAFTTAFSRKLKAIGFAHAPSIDARKPGRYQIEVYPHPAIVNLFGLDRIVRYKKGRVTERRAGLNRLRDFIAGNLPLHVPALEAGSLPEVPNHGGAALKAFEDRLDAVIAAYVGAHWWYWATEKNTCYGTARDGYIIVPTCTQTAGAVKVGA